MFLIANSWNRELTISDLGITLGATQALDLHKIKTLIPPESSKDLKKAQSKGAVKILHQNSKKTKEKNTTEVIVKETFDKEALLRDIQGLLEKEIDKRISPSKDNNQIEEVLALMKQMAQNQNSPQEHKKEETSKSKNSEDLDLDMDRLVRIHSKSLNKMSKNVVGDMKTQEEIKNDEISKNIDELSNLL